MSNTLNYYGRSKVVVEFVKELLRLSNDNLQSITITRQGKSEDFCVSVAISLSSGETLEKVLQKLDGY